MLLEYGGLRLLTDPSFDPPGEYPRGSYEPLRKTVGPAVSVKELGSIDAVLLSHDHHADNLDGEGRRLLPRAGTVITTAAGAARLDIEAIGLEPWQSTELTRPDGSALAVTAVPAQHGPDGTDHLTGPVIGFALAGEGLPSTYVSGDNASVAVVEAIAERLGSFAIAVLFVGGARLAPFDDYLTLPAERAARVALILDAEAVIPTHFDGWDHFTEGFGELQAAFARAGLAERLLPARPGATVHVAATLRGATA
jgi:L-ascorbate metabolism protein UlaG (beta-lactamase superfamily)